MFSSLYVLSFAVYAVGLVLYIIYSVKLSQDVREGRIPVRDTEH